MADRLFSQFRERISARAHALENAAPQEILAWALDAWRGRIALACSFGGPSGMVLLDMALRLDARIYVFTLDTDFLFPQTYAHIQRAEQHYGISVRRVQAAQSPREQADAFGESLWQRDPDLCCRLRKVLPQRDALQGMEAWISGLRRDQSTTRNNTAIAAWDEQFEVIKVSPLAAWSSLQVWDYIRRHDVPYNPLHDQGYPSLGCTHCTRAIAEGDDIRAGRWSGHAKTECGLHQTRSTP